MTESVVTNLVEAVKTGRSDVVRSVISAYEKGVAPCLSSARARRVPGSGSALSLSDVVIIVKLVNT